MRLNLGCGFNKMDGYVNVDANQDCSPDEVANLEDLPWPWPDNSVDQIVMTHVLEHLGQTSNVYTGIIKELYRICQHDGRIIITVPHPRHDTFIIDPTHVRPITTEGLSMFSRRNCENWIETGAANTPLALIHNVDFEIESSEFVLDQPWRSKLEVGSMTESDLVLAIRQYNNVVQETKIVLREVKNG